MMSSVNNKVPFSFLTLIFSSLMFCCRRLNLTKQHGVFYSNNKSGFTTFLRPFEVRHLNSEIDYMICWENPSSEVYLEEELPKTPPSKAIWFLSEHYPWVLGLADMPSDDDVVGERGAQQDAESEEGGEETADESQDETVSDIFENVLSGIWMCRSGTCALFSTS